jgi:hypothetical protein
MELDSAKIFPRWMQEFRRFQALKSQFYLYGNVYDCYYFPVNYHQVATAEDLKWAKFNDIKQLLMLYLKNEAYEIITYYDIIDGLEMESSDQEISKHNIVNFLCDDNTVAKNYFESKKIQAIERKVSDTLSFFRLLEPISKVL